MVDGDWKDQKWIQEGWPQIFAQYLYLYHQITAKSWPFWSHWQDFHWYKKVVCFFSLQSMLSFPLNFQQKKHQKQVCVNLRPSWKPGYLVSGFLQGQSSGVCPAVSIGWASGYQHIVWVTCSSSSGLACRKPLAQVRNNVWGPEPKAITEVLEDPSDSSTFSTELRVGWQPWLITKGLFWWLGVWQSACL